MCKQETDLIKKVVALQQINDWQGIVGMFNCESAENIPEEIRGYVAFAAGHLMDNYLAESNECLKRYKNGEKNDNSEKLAQDTYEKNLMGYIKLHFLLEDIVGLEPHNRQVLSVWGYRNYLLATGKQTREIKAVRNEYAGNRQGEINNSFRKIFKKADEESMGIYEKLLEMKPDDIKSIYRYARILQYKGNEFKKGAVASDFREKDGYLLKAVCNYEKVIREYKKLTEPEEKKRYRKEYERSRYQLINIVCDRFVNSIIEKEQPVTYCKDEATPFLNLYGSSLLPRYAVLKLIKNKMDDLDALLTENGIAHDSSLTDDAIKAIAQKELNINVYDLLYRKAKMYLVMGLVYCSNLISGYNVPVQTLLDKRKYYFNKGLEYAQYVSDVKLELRRAGKESGGFVYELGLMGRLYYLLGDNEALIQHYTAMDCNNWLRKTVQFTEVSYYLGAMYIYDKHHRDDSKALKYLNSISEKSMYYKKAQRLLDDLKKGTI